MYATTLFFSTLLLVVICESRPQQSGGFIWPGTGTGSSTTLRPQTRPTTSTTGRTTPTTTVRDDQLQNCISNCNLRTTQEYNPVCATNGQSFDNPTKLKCARETCGMDVQIAFYSRCQRDRT